jgi:hypothetical protein
MQTWQILFAAVGAAIGLVYLGIRLGVVISSARSAHHRIDTLETLLQVEFAAMRTDLKDAIKNAWRNCPLAHDGGHKGP